MANLLYLVHRLPYPPNKGDKVRSFHLLRHLLTRHRVFLGTFIDDPDDAQHLTALRALCPDLHVAHIDPRAAKVRSLTGLLRHEALTLAYYRNGGLNDWVRRTVALHQIDTTVVFSSAMAQYAPAGVPMVVDFVDLDSAKWTQYASAHRWPLSWLYRREGRRLLAYERAVASRASQSFFVTDQETKLFQDHAPECAAHVEALSNGVDSVYFSVDPARPSPYPSDEIALVFTGAMDYWPNIDAATWFANEVVPLLRPRWPMLHFYVVGRSPTPDVLALASEFVTVTGTVPDVRPYLQHASLAVAPLRLARGIQNKILEAMAMGKAVVASSECADAIGAQDEVELLSAPDAQGLARQITALLESPARVAAVGTAARRKVQRSFSWDAHLAGIDKYLSPHGQPIAALAS